jgi:hypothetical protein
MVLLMDVLDVGIEAWFRCVGAAYVVWSKAIEESVEAACEMWAPRRARAAHED